MAGRKRVLSVFQTVSIQMPCFRCRLVHISKGLHPPTCVTGSCSCEKEFLLSLRKGEDENMFFLFAWSEDKVTEAMIPPPHLPQWERKCFYFLGKSCQKTPRSELCTGLPLPAQGSCQPLFFLLACGEGSRPVLDSVPLPTVPTGSL